MSPKIILTGKKKFEVKSYFSIERMGLQWNKLYLLSKLLKTHDMCEPKTIMFLYVTYQLSKNEHLLLKYMIPNKEVIRKA